MSAEIVRAECLKLGRVGCLYPACSCAHAKLMLAAAAAERSRILAVLRDLHEHRLRDAATVLARRHYAERFCKTEGDPHVEMNAQANWMIFAPQVLSVAVLLADAIEATPDAH